MPWNTNLGGRLSTVDLLIKLACFGKNVNNIFCKKGAKLNLLVQGGQQYWAFPFSETSQVLPSSEWFCQKLLSHCWDYKLQWGLFLWLVSLKKIFYLCAANVTSATYNCNKIPEKSHWRERLYTVGLLVLTSLVQLLFILEILFTFFPKQATSMRRSTVLILPLDYQSVKVDLLESRERWKMLYKRTYVHKKLKVQEQTCWHE